MQVTLSLTQILIGDIQVCMSTGFKVNSRKVVWVFFKRTISVFSKLTEGNQYLWLALTG